MENTGIENSGDWNSGNMNSGNMNSGNRNIGDWNIGDWNSGDWNSGNRNSGNRNSGNRNSGDWNSGSWNSGNRNSGNRNSGSWNSGSWNSGNRNSGYFNIDEPKVRIFGKETEIQRNEIFFPDFLYFNLTEWISENNMTQEQKDCKENEYYKNTGGILVAYEYKEAFQKSYESLSKEEKIEQTEQLKKLPNFDKDIFFEISGIKIDNEVGEEPQEKIVTDEDGRKYKLVLIE